MIRTGQKPLVVHVVLQDADPAAENPTRALAVEIYTRLARGPRSTGIPVHVWMATGSMGALDLPEQAPLPDAERNAILLLVDQPFFEAREQWKRYLAVLDKALRRERDLLLPIAICKDAHWVARALNNINSVPVKDPKTVAEDEHVFQDILTAILRLLPEPSPESSLLQPSFGSAQESVAAPPPVFLCHTKRDGEGLARNLRQYIQNQTQLRCFFDLYDLPHGQTVKDFIQTSISVSCLLVVWTDSLLESRWCQFEILEARSQQRPLLVLDALSVDSPRIFPFLSNMPVLRWRDNPAQVVSALLLELVRTRHMRVLFGSLRDSDSQITSFVVHAPDIMEASSVLRPRKINLASIELASQLVVYPDPPLRSEELGFLRRAFPTLHLHSLSEWTALRAANALSNITAPPVKERPAPLSHLPVGLSVSETETWKRLGLIREHQDDFVVDMARELILLGARLLWGGDLRPDGLGMRLETLVDAYRPADRAPQDHIACYLAWPIHRKVTPKNLQERRAFADVRCQPRPNLTKSRSSPCASR